MMCNYFRFGGLRNDVPEGWLDRTRDLVDRFPAFLDEYEQLLCENEIILSRTQGVGQFIARTGHQRRHHRPDAARQRRGV